MTEASSEKTFARAKVLADLDGVIRPDLLDAHRRGWDWISGPGTWLDGDRRCAVVHEIRNARACALCRDRKEALSPFAIDGEHESLGELEPVEVEVVHRLVTDPGRLSAQWLDGLLDDGLSDGEYIEIAGIVAMAMMMDAFTWSIDVAPAPNPAPRPGAPSPYRPPGAAKQDSWVAIVAPENVVPSDGDLYPDTDAGVHRALSLVPDTKRAFWELGEAHYIPMSDVWNFDARPRAISRPQIEMLAARVSALHQCVF